MKYAAWVVLVLLAITAVVLVALRIFLWSVGRTTRLRCNHTVELTSTPVSDRDHFDFENTPGKIGPCHLCRWHFGAHLTYMKSGQKVAFDGADGDEVWAVAVQ